MPIGYSFQPSAPSAQGAQTPQLTPQEAVRILSLRLPKSPQNLPVPQQLLTSQGGGGAAGGGSLTTLLQALMRAAGGGGSRELVSDAPVPAIDHGMGGSRPNTFMPRINISDQGDAVRNDDPMIGSPEPIMDDTPLFDAGTPKIRPGLGRRMAEPLF